MLRQNILMRSKKGVVEIQFNWLFALIAGAIILLVFTTIIMKQRDVSDASTNAFLLNSIDSILAGSESVAGTAKTVTIPPAVIKFECNSVSIGGSSKPINAMNVFTPSVLEGSSMITMTKEWDVPYKVNNFVYLTNTNIKYAFVCNPNSPNFNFANDMVKMLPDSVAKELYFDVDNILDEGYDEVRIIVFDDSVIIGVPTNLNKAKKVTVLKVFGDKNTGELWFYELSENTPLDHKTSYYITESTLLGAIFTDKPEIYECVMNNALKKFEIVSQIHRGRVGSLSKPLCDYNYNDILGHINNFLSYLNGISSSGSYDINLIDKTKMYEYTTWLENENTKLLTNSCPLIY
jgi:hypothetical protein